MTENKRILLNIVVTYGRSLFALLCGLFTSRWILATLGEVDYGLFGVVGGLTAFIAFFNGLLSAGVGRFYAVSIGESKTDPVTGLETCRQWFNTALVLHFVIPCLLMIIGYPLGEYALRNEWLKIPPERLEACIWVFRFTCVSCFIAMLNIPFQAMYVAKQYIAELTIYSFITTTLNVCVLYYMLTHPSDWLSRYALWVAMMNAVPQIIICIRAWIVFPECQICKRYLWSWKRTKAILSYSGWISFGALGALLRGQGLAILINRSFGARVNSAMTIGNHVTAQVSTLSASMQGAFSPAIMNAYGAGEYKKMRMLAYRACKFGTLLLLFFLLPLVIELPYVLKLWLKEPPAYTTGLCLCALAVVLIDKTSIGHMIAVNASGKIAVYHMFLGGALICTLPLAWLFVRQGYGVYSVGVAMVITTSLCAWGRVAFAQKLVKMSAMYWLFRIFLPICVVLLVSGAVGLIPQYLMSASFIRLCCSSAMTESMFLVLTWVILLDKEEKAFVLQKIQKVLRRKA